MPRRGNVRRAFAPLSHHRTCRLPRDDVRAADPCAHAVTLSLYVAGSFTMKCNLCGTKWNLDSGEARCHNPCSGPGCGPTLVGDWIGPGVAQLAKCVPVKRWLGSAFDLVVFTPARLSLYFRCLPIHQVLNLLPGSRLCVSCGDPSYQN